MTKATRVHVTLEDFLRVTIVERDSFDTVECASDELGMTPASFKQRLIKSRKRYPNLYQDVPAYAADGRSIPTESEAADVLAGLLAGSTLAPMDAIDEEDTEDAE